MIPFSELTRNLQFGAKTITGISCKICRRLLSFKKSVHPFFKLRIRVSEGHFQCVHTIQFSEPTKIGSLKSDRVNGPLEVV